MRKGFLQRFKGTAKYGQDVFLSTPIILVRIGSSGEGRGIPEGKGEAKADLANIMTLVRKVMSLMNNDDEIGPLHI